MNGRLIYVMGPSGAGKDSLLDALRQRLCGLPVAFPRRYITRAASAGGEHHIPVSPEQLDKRGYLRYVRAEGETPRYEVVGESFIVPRSFMGYRDENDQYRSSWGTGEYKLDIELRETCDVTDQYRANWKQDRKRRKKMQPKEDFLNTTWQVISSQKWDELTRSWVITTLQAPAGIITQDVIDKLGLEPEAAPGR